MRAMTSLLKSLESNLISMLCFLRDLIFRSDMIKTFTSFGNKVVQHEIVHSFRSLWDLLSHVYSQFALKCAYLVMKLNGSRQHKFVHN